MPFSIEKYIACEIRKGHICGQRKAYSAIKMLDVIPEGTSA